MPYIGETSCKKHGGCDVATEKTCNPDCIDYDSNGKEPNTPGKINKPEKPKGPMIVPSTLKNFSKRSEFVVMKGKVFNIQSISPKKIILKLKGAVNAKHPLPTGIYCIKEPDGVVKDLKDAK